MASTFSIISTVFLTTGVLFIVQGVALIVLYVSKWRQGRWGSPQRDDHANMMILFQSMRDLLEEQKRLARQLNEDIDRKLTRINLVVHEALDSAQNHAPRSQGSPATASRASRAQSDPDAREAFLREARKLSSHSSPSAESAEPPRSSEPANTGAPPERPASPEGFRAVAEDESAGGPTGERFDAWVGLDFAGDTPNPYRVEVPEQPPAAPEDAEKAREAFRSLLDLHHDDNPADSAEPPTSPTSAQGLGGPPERPGKHDTNGSRKLTPLQRRVQEYADAGMSVPQIARELGIGKGEVRLILSLREGRKV